MPPTTRPVSTTLIRFLAVLSLAAGLAWPAAIALTRPAQASTNNPEVELFCHLTYLPMLNQTARSPSPTVTP